MSYGKARLQLNLYPATSSSVQRASFVIHTLDELFARERLGFAHLDLEDHEIDALRGAHVVLHRDQPVFTTEVTVHRFPERVTELMLLIDALGYDSYLCEEVAGMRVSAQRGSIVN
jgi:hypothetical protein